MGFKVSAIIKQKIWRGKWKIFGTVSFVLPS